MYTLRDLAAPLLLLSMLGTDLGVSAVKPLPPGAPVVREYTYRLRGAIRPLLFWIAIASSRTHSIETFGKSFTNAL